MRNSEPGICRFTAKNTSRYFSSSLFTTFRVPTSSSLINPDGVECDTRPVSSRLFRPSSSEPEAVKNGTNGLNRGSGDQEKMEMARRMAEIEAQLADRDQFCSSVAIKQVRDRFCILVLY